MKALDWGKVESMPLVPIQQAHILNEWKRKLQYHVPVGLMT